MAKPIFLALLRNPSDFLQLKCLAHPLAAKRLARFIRLPAIRISEINRRSHHIVTHDPRQFRRQNLTIHRGARLNDQLIHATTILHDPAILDIPMIDDFVTFLWRRHEWLGEMKLQRPILAQSRPDENA